MRPKTVRNFFLPLFFAPSSVSRRERERPDGDATRLVVRTDDWVDRNRWRWKNVRKNCEKRFVVICKGKMQICRTKQSWPTSKWERSRKSDRERERGRRRGNKENTTIIMYTRESEGEREKIAATASAYLIRIVVLSLFVALSSIYTICSAPTAIVRHHYLGWTNTW